MRSKLQLLLFSVPLGFYLATQSFTLFLCIFGRSGDIDFQLYVYYSSAVMLLLEIALFLIAMALSPVIETVLKEKKWPAWAACLSGLVGMGILYMSSQIWELVPDVVGLWFSGVGLLLLAIFSVLGLLLLGVRLVAFEVDDMAIALGIGGCVYAAVSLFKAVVLTSILGIVVLTCLMFVFVLPRLPLSSEETIQEKTADSKKRAGGLVLLFFITVTLGFIAAVFPRLFSTSHLGEIAKFEGVLIFAIGLFAFAVMTGFLFKRKLLHETISVGFSFCSMAYILTFFLATIFFTGDADMFGVAVIKSNQVVLQMFSFVLIMYAVKLKRLTLVKALSLFGIFSLAAPLLFINAVVKPLNFTFSFFAAEEMLIPATALIAILVVALSFWAMIANMNKQKQGETLSADELERTRCEMAAQESGLTPREFDILLYLHRGYSAKKIASVLYISSSTVQSHIVNLYKKMKVHSKQELIDKIDEISA